MKKLASVSCVLLFWLEATSAESLADEISRYSEKDELAAKEVMNESCSKRDKANSELLDLSKKINATLEKNLAARKTSSPDSEKAFKELENFNQAELNKLESECTTARNNYERIFKVRDHAYIEAERIDRESNLRKQENEREQLRNTRMQPTQPTTTNCTSNVVGETVYTRCNSY